MNGEPSASATRIEHKPVNRPAPGLPDASGWPQTMYGADRPSTQRGSAWPLPFKAVHDRDAYYEINAVVMRSAHGLVVVVQDDMYRFQDPFYLFINGKTVRFEVAQVRRGMRPQDTKSTRVLYLVLSGTKS